MSLQLKKFNMNMIKDDQVVILIGKRNTGKSFLTRDLLHQHKHIPTGIVISPTENANKFYGNYIPPIFIHHEYNSKITSEFMKRQKAIKRRIMTGEDDIDGRAFLILDDCLYDNDWKKDKIIREIFMNGRHWSILFILIMQYAMGIGPNLRTNVDWVFLCRETNMSNKRKLYEHYAGMFPTFEIFCQTFDQCTENYGCLVLHTSSKSNKLEEQVYWYVGEYHENFKTCCPEAWLYSDQNFKDEIYEDDDLETVIQRRRKVNLKVKKIN